MKIREVALDRFGVWHQFALPPLQPGVNVVYLDDTENADQLYHALTGAFFGFQTPVPSESSQVQITLELNRREAPFRQLRVRRRGGPEPYGGAYRERVELTELPPGNKSPVSWWRVWSRSAHRIRHFYWSANPVSPSIERRLATSPLLPAPNRRKKRTLPPAAPRVDRAGPVQADLAMVGNVPGPPPTVAAPDSPPVLAALGLTRSEPSELGGEQPTRDAELQRTLDQLQQLDEHHAELTRLLAELAAIGDQLAELRRLDREQREELKRHREVRQQAETVRQELARWDARLKLLRSALEAWPIWQRNQRWQQLAEHRAQRAGYSQPPRAAHTAVSAACDHEQRQVRWLQEHARITQAHEELQRQLDEQLARGPHAGDGPPHQIDGPQQPLADRSVDRLTGDLRRLERLLADEPALELALRRQRAVRRRDRSRRLTDRRDRLRRARQTLIELREPARRLKGARAAWRNWSTVDAEEAWRQTSLLMPAAADSVWEASVDPPAGVQPVESAGPHSATISPDLLSEIELLRRRIDLGVEMRGMREQLEQLEDENRRTLANEATPEQALRYLIGFLALGLLMLLGGLMLPRGSSGQLVLVVLGLVSSVASALIKISYDRSWSRRREHYEYHRQMLLTALTDSAAEVDELSSRLPSGDEPLEVRLQQLLDRLEGSDRAKTDLAAELPSTVPLSVTGPLPRVLPTEPTPAEAWERRRPHVEGDLRRAQREWRQALRGQRLDESMTPRRVFQLVRDAAGVAAAADSPTVRPRVPTELQAQIDTWRRGAAELTDTPVTGDTNLPAWRELLPRVRDRADLIRIELDHRGRQETARLLHGQRVEQLRQQLADVDQQAQRLLRQAGAADRGDLERQLRLAQRWIRTARRWQQATDRCDRMLASDADADATGSLIRTHDRATLCQQQREAEQARRELADRMPREVIDVPAAAAGDSLQVQARMDALEARQQQLQAQSQRVGEHLGAATELRESLVRWSREEAEARQAARLALEARLRLAASPVMPVAELSSSTATPAATHPRSTIGPGAQRRRESRTTRETASRRRADDGREGADDARRLNGVFAYFVRQMTRGRCRAVRKGRDGRLVAVLDDGRRCLPSELPSGLRRQVALGLHLGQALLVGSSSPQVPLIWRLPDSADRWWDTRLASQLIELARRAGCQVILIVSSELAARRLGRGGLAVIDVLRETSAAEWSSLDDVRQVPTVVADLSSAGAGAGTTTSESGSPGDGKSDGVDRRVEPDPLAGAEAVEYQVAVPPERGPGVWQGEVWPSSPPPPRQWLTESLPAEAQPVEAPKPAPPLAPGSGPQPIDWRDEPPTWFPD